MRFILRRKMKSSHESYLPILRSASLANSDTLEGGLIDCRNLTAISITGRAKFNASGTGNLTVSLYYSPDGKNFDSTAFSTLTITCSAGNNVQASKIVSVPDTGYIKISIANADATYSASDVALWASVIYQFLEDRQTQAST